MINKEYYIHCLKNILYKMEQIYILILTVDNFVMNFQKLKMNVEEEFQLMKWVSGKQLC